MYVEPPSRIAIVGAGPIGLECALYARYLGYTIDLYEQGRIGESLLQSPDVQLSGPFEMNRSPLGLAAINAQHPDWQRPVDDAQMTGREFLDAYLSPLAQTDLIRSSIHEQSRVISITRQEPPQDEQNGDEQECDQQGDDQQSDDQQGDVFPFHLLIEESAGEQRTADAEVVIDTGSHIGANGQLNFFVLGAKNGENDSQFLISTGLAQIQQLFTVIGDRQDLDVYATMKGLV